MGESNPNCTWCFSYLTCSCCTKNSGLTVLLILIAIVLVITEFEKTITGLFIAHNLRFFTIGLGVLTIILAGLALTYPIATARVLLLILGFSLMVDGFQE